MLDSIQFDAVATPLRFGPEQGEMRAGHLRGFFEQVHGSGGDPRAILERHGIDPFGFSDPDSYLDCSAAVNMLEFCADRFNDRLFGARLARRQSADVFGAAAALGRAAPTFGEGLRCVREFLPVIHSSEGALLLFSTRHRAEHRWTGDGLFETNVQGNFQSLILQLKLLQMLGGSDFHPDYVMLRADMTAREIVELEDWIGCRVSARQEHNAIGFSAQVLDWPILTSNRPVFSIIKSFLESIQKSKPTFTEKVAAYLQDNLSTGACSLERCAKALGTSRRMLQWRLHNDGLTFSEMVEQERVRLARRLLTESPMSIIEIAGLLGYSEQSSFGRACRRWFGVAPGALRRSAMKGGVC
jgi:AraC-like DNA-binding protein